MKARVKLKMQIIEIRLHAGMGGPRLPVEWKHDPLWQLFKRSNLEEFKQNIWFKEL